jgi:hypothetical protein
VGVGEATGHKGAEMGKRLRTHLLLMAIINTHGSDIVSFLSNTDPRFLSSGVKRGIYDLIPTAAAAMFHKTSPSSVEKGT